MTECVFIIKLLSQFRPGLPFWSKVIDVAQQTGGEYILSPLMKNVPGVTPISLLIGFQLVKLQYGTLQEEEVVRTPWAIHFRDGIDIMRVYDLEFAFPIDIDHPLKAVQAIRKVIDIVKDYAFNGKLTESVYTLYIYLMITRTYIAYDISIQTHRLWKLYLIIRPCMYI